MKLVHADMQNCIRNIFVLILILDAASENIRVFNLITMRIVEAPSLQVFELKCPDAANTP